VTLFKRSVSSRSVALFSGEVLLICGSIAVAVRMRGDGSDLSDVAWKAAVTAVLWQLCLYYNDFYNLTITQSSRELVVRLLQAVGAATIVLAGLYAVVPALDLGTWVVITALCLFLVGVLTWRLLFNQVAHANPMGERILIVGTGSDARAVARQILLQHDFAYRLVGFIDDREPDGAAAVPRQRVIGTHRDIPRLVQEHGVDRIVVGLSDRRGHLPIRELMQAKLAGVRVEDLTATYERITGKILIDNLRPSWLIFSDGFRVSRTARAVKRAMDVGLALVGLLLAFPLMLLTALAVFVESGRPVLYCQERVGENGVTFVLYKFRSMRTDAESGTPIWARSQDDRVTRVGRLIRATRLDELPQLWNVLRGDMSFVGPRPERPFFVERLAQQIPFYQQRHAVKPGVTGWAQVKYRYGASVEDAMEKLRYDLYYIKNLSPFFDLTIVVDTVKVILFRQGAQ
jgi:sugar transferase (PEP-CTERM system associated)